MRTSFLILFSMGVVIRSEITFSVEEPGLDIVSPGARHEHRHHHHHRRRDQVGSKDGESVPYKAAASTVSAVHPAGSGSARVPAPVPEQFSLNCPHVADASNSNMHIEVTWTLDDTVWLKIRDGEKKVVNRLTSFNKRNLGGKTVLRVTLQDGRYFFSYDELTGDFAMEISPVVGYEDAGVWQCHVTVKHDGKTHTLTSRSRVKAPPGDENKPRPSTIGVESDRLSTTAHTRHALPAPTLLPDEYFPPARIDYEPAQRTSSFTRPNPNNVQISRDSNKRRQTVVFDRAVTREYAPQRLASIDYELSMADEEENDDDRHLGPGKTRARAASYYGDQPLSTTTSSSLAISLILVSVLLGLAR